MTVGRVQQKLDQDRFFAYSGLLQGDATSPATVTLVDIPDSGLRNAIIQIQPFFGLPITTATNEGLGIQVLIDDEIVFEQKSPDPFYRGVQSSINLFLKKQSKLTVLSLNTNGNNSQSRGANLVGYFV